MNSKPVVAMALGGLGGFNAHDAGVLAAAHECGLEPDIITCTSGAIFWTHLFLTSPGVTTLPVAVLQYLEYHIDPMVAAVAVAQTVGIAMLLLLLDRFVRLGRVVQ